MYYSETTGLQRTDISKWRLRISQLGGQKWEFIGDNSEDDPQSEVTKYLLKDSSFRSPEFGRAKNALEACMNGAKFFDLIQDKKSGTWPVQYKGPMFMTVGYVIASYFTKTPIPEEKKIEIIRYIVNTAHPVDGGWGLFESDKSTCFGTSINYVTLRLLGLPSSHPACVRARDTLLRLGGAIGMPHWGKAWLSLLGLYKWEGVNPAPPELFVLPYWTLIHPMKWWVHTRAIYLPLGYFSSTRTVYEDAFNDPLLAKIRSEIYTKPFDEIDFSQHRNNVCGVDLYYPHTKVLNFLNWAMVKYEKYVRPKWLLDYSNDQVYDLILKELYNTEYLSIAPVNAAFNTIFLYVKEGGDSPNFLRIMNRMSEVLFLGPQGMTVMGTNGSQVWDTAFAIQYYFAAGIAELPDFKDLIIAGFKFLIRSQFTEECAPGSFRDKRKGAWPFSTKEQGYTVSDCTAEAIKAIIMVLNSDYYKDVHDLYDPVKFNDGIDVLLGLQNVGSFEFGSFSTYEKIKSTPYLEMINPAEVFGNIMVEYPYVECTDSSILGLTYFHKYYDYRSEDIEIAIDRAIKYVCKSQKPDGSWYGCWGVCFTYAGMFALEALHSINETYASNEYAKKGCDFLASKQLPDGGWGETMKSCETHTYVSTKEGLVVQTAWALIGLILADYPDKEAIEKGIKFLMSRQLPNGGWDFELVEGVFNHSCGIEYPNYRYLFPIKALGLYCKKYGTDN